MMTLSAIDQALDVALAGILFGSVTWISCAFSIFVVTQKRKQRQSSAIAGLPAAKTMPLLAPASVPLLQVEPVATPLLQAEPSAEFIAKPSIEIIIEPPLLVSTDPLNGHSARTQLPAPPVELVESKHASKPVEKTTVAPVVQKAKAVSKAVPKTIKSKALKQETRKQKSPKIEIVCEPVNWKKWKVADLRKASFARAFGVRTRPVGSKRTLPKADLVAQYEQQLKRLAKTADQAVSQAEDVA